ncbi:MAG TPA: hypothetical protein VHS34_05335 [Terriglobales bacterium]|nr:hypothetical protein [Terriglobales bacterium]
MTASPDSPVDKLSSDPGSAKLPKQALRGTALENPPRSEEFSAPTGVQLWLHRLFILLFVFLCAAMGVLLLILPWRPEWTDNHFLLGSPGLRAFVSSGFVRGLCSGLGLLDIWIGFWEAVHFHDHTRN